jgi:Uma2 family endonuclease
MNVVTPKRFTIDEYHQLIELGFLKEGDRIELIRGELIQMVAKGTPHTVCSSILCRQLDRLLGHRVVIRGQDPITLQNQSEPEVGRCFIRFESDFSSIRCPIYPLIVFG